MFYSHSVRFANSIRALWHSWKKILLAFILAFRWRFSHNLVLVLADKRLSIQLVFTKLLIILEIWLPHHKIHILLYKVEYPCIWGQVNLRIFLIEILVPEGIWISSSNEIVSYFSNHCQKHTSGIQWLMFHHKLQELPMHACTNAILNYSSHACG